MPSEKISLSPTKQKIFFSVLIIIALFVGFGMGNIQPSKLDTTIVPREIKPEISIIKLNAIKGDELEAEVSGPVRIVWGEKNFAENDGIHQIPLSQIPNENDLKFFQFSYVGNVKSKKFYPADSYFARGTEVQYRRFFLTKEEAIGAGFEASKSVK